MSAPPAYESKGARFRKRPLQVCRSNVKDAGWRASRQEPSGPLVRATGTQKARLTKHRKALRGSGQAGATRARSRSLPPRRARDDTAGKVALERAHAKKVMGHAALSSDLRSQKS